jgi:hypothetical protein
MDDYICHCWIYLIKNKSDVEEIFYLFQSHVECVLSTKILVVQSDWGGEYHRLDAYFRRIGITHCVSCPHTSQQNGVVERKHRHLVETRLAPLAHSSLPLRYWDEAFFTICYLFNRMPSPVTDNQAPLTRLLNQSPDYFFLRMFGCACCPSLCKYDSRKLEFRCTMCVFLGNSAMHKGYKCLDRSPGHIYISCDIIFDEAVCPFATPSTVIDFTTLLLGHFPAQEPAIHGPNLRNYDMTLLLVDSPGALSLPMQVSASSLDATDAEGAVNVPVPPMHASSPALASPCAAPISPHRTSSPGGLVSSADGLASPRACSLSP